MTQAGVQAGALVSQGQRAVRVGEVVEEDAASDGQTHRAQASGSQTGALGLGSVVNIGSELGGREWGQTCSSVNEYLEMFQILQLEDQLEP